MPSKTEGGELRGPARASAGKFSSGRWAAGALAISDRGRGPRVAQRWLVSEGRRAPPPQMGEAEGGEAESSSYESSCSYYSYYSFEAEAEY